MLSDSEVIILAKKGLRAELTATEIYSRLSKRYAGTSIGKKLGGFVEAEKRHAAFWRSFMRNRNVNFSSITFSGIQVSLLVFVYRVLGLGLSLKLLEASERRVIQLFSQAVKSDLLTAKEKNDVRGFLSEELLHEESFLDYEAKFRQFISEIGTVFSQASDGLVIVISTSLGLAGVYTNSFWIGIVGLIVGFAATLDTVVKTYLLNRTALRFKKDILGKLRTSCSLAPEAYERRIEKYMKQKNYDDQTCRQIVATAKEKNFVEAIIAEEEYGIKEKAFESPVRTAFRTGGFKMVGVVLPMIPFLIGDLSFAIPVSIIIMVVLLSLIGSVAAVVAEVNVKRKILELTTTGLMLAALTFLVGKVTAILTASMNIR